MKRRNLKRNQNRRKNKESRLNPTTSRGERKRGNKKRKRPLLEDPSIKKTKPNAKYQKTDAPQDQPLKIEQGRQTRQDLVRTISLENSRRNNLIPTAGIGRAQRKRKEAKKIFANKPKKKEQNAPLSQERRQEEKIRTLAAMKKKKASLPSLVSIRPQKDT